MPKYTLVLDSSQLSLYLECPQMWYYLYVKKLAPTALAELRKNEAMNAGTYGHKLLDVYYRAKAEKKSLTDAALLAYSYNPDTDTCANCGCLAVEHVELKAFNTSECHKCRRCTKGFAPKHFDLQVDTRIAVQNRLRDYFYTYQENDFKPLTPDHVEVGFAVPVFEDAENLFVLEGRIDLIAIFQTLLTIVDHKFQMRQHELYDRSIQFKNYTLAWNLAHKDQRILMLVINYIRLHKSVDKTTLVRHPVCFTVAELLDWKSKLVEIFFRIKGDLVGNDFYQNWSACAGKFGYKCNYTPLCEESDSKMKENKERMLYEVQKEIWRPW